MKISQWLSVKKTSLAVLLFYLLVGFEFFYMASPFAIYLYSVYKPGLVLLDRTPVLAWTTGFFMPHLVKNTQSWLLNVREITGFVLASAGLFVFLVCMVQIYFAKLRKKGVVTGGIYKRIRHPQYAAFIVCGLGLLLLWPRYLSLLLFVSLCFAYRFLASVEEKECERKYGASYLAYKQRTHGFFFLTFPIHLSNRNLSKTKRMLCWFLFFGLCLGLSLGSAWGLKRYSINNLYSTYSNNQFTLSIYRMTTEEIEKLVSLARKDAKVDSLIIGLERDEVKMINYITPATMYISEIPMTKSDTAGCHVYSQNVDFCQFKIVFTKAVFQNSIARPGIQIALHAIGTIPVLEVWVDLKNNQVVRIIDLPETTRYQNIPMPIF